MLVKLVEVASSSQLALAAFLSVATAGIAYSFFRRAPIWAQLLVFFGIMIFAFLLAIRLIVPPPQGAPQPVAAIDPIKLMRVLSIYGPAERMVKCKLLEKESVCQTLIEAMADLAPVATTADYRAQVSRELASGTVTPSTVSQVSGALPTTADRVVTLGDPKGWDVDVFWCGGANGAAMADNAKRAAAVLASAGGAPIAPGISVGRVRVRELKTSNPRMPQPGGGAYVSIDNMAGKRDAVAAITERLKAQAGFTYQPRPTGSRLANYISLFECR